jgi:hypothetical protein
MTASVLGSWALEVTAAGIRHQFQCTWSPSRLPGSEIVL